MASMSRFSENLVKIVVGPDRHVFMIHEETTRHSGFLKACLEHPFRESATRTIELPEDLPEAISHVINHLYGAKLELKLSTRCTLPIQPPTQQDRDVLLAMLQLYVTANKLLLPGLQNEIMKLIYRHAETYVVDPTLITLLDGLQNTPLHRFFIEDCACNVLEHDFKSLCDFQPLYRTCSVGLGPNINKILSEISRNTASNDESELSVDRPLEYWLVTEDGHWSTVKTEQ